MMIDPIDRKILGLVQRNAKVSLNDISKRVNLSISAVNERLRKLQAAGVIRGYEARLDPKALGREICAFVHVLLEKPEHDKGFRDAVMATKQVQECHHVTGDYSYLLKIRVGSTQELERVIVEGLKALPGVARTETQIALSSPKESLAIDVAERG